MSLLGKEIKLTAKSLTYVIFVLFLGIFIYTQLGLNSVALKEPSPNQETYGTRPTMNKKSIQQQTIFQLFLQYKENSYTTYPFGIYRAVTASAQEQAKIAEILEQASGQSLTNLDKWFDAALNQSEESDVDEFSATFPLAKTYAYQTFQKDMQQVEKIIGSGSDFSSARYKSLATEPLTYEDAQDEFNQVLTVDHVSGAVARLTCDYLGIILALLPVFLTATVVLRDKRANAQLVIHTKKVSTIKLYATRFFATCTLILLPVIVITLMPALQAVFVAHKYQQVSSFFLFYQYIIGWLVPTIVAVVGLSFLVTTLFNGLISIIVQLVIWLLSLMNQGLNLVGSVGMSLIPRFNALGQTEIFYRMLPDLIKNRVFWLSFGIICFIVSCVLADWKRKGGGFFAKRGKDN
ncbi:hypothetical protein BAU15_02455 [Enterococcus sp. JM4C]|uniref:ABC transporter permease n=1 Tax=Candidatus Enterococcus huntleyi TaxID=1857217 RepID=UPI00137AE889|nr:ABC transporter permease [Enterococcus sp. JM4C]KAF1299524.1 hypothetical protein BAU15_02455 [Enterococcus sp. JM4C]